MISIEANPIRTCNESPMVVSSKQVVLDEKLVRDFPRTNYTMDKFREQTCAQPFGEDVLVMKPLVE